ncbi:sigma-E processing peptidase SpoIIGA [Candidatus Clostridium stratigraminis]|uniref:Sporulation sigma-E factor-processing peptidase n=1 Tax=Candidatus Clostridium stratigraminis TaxID=3381661 RepID=A0ABW8T5Q9_9CLOT
MVVNIDILVLENSIVNYFLLYITSQTLRIRKSFKNIALPAFLGGIYVITLIFPRLYILTELPFKLLIALFMIFILFYKSSILFYSKALFVYLLYSMVLAGLCFFIELNYNGGFQVNSLFYNFSYKKLMLAVILLYLTLNRLVLFIRNKIELSSLIFSIDIVFKNGEKTVKAFLDTGNELTEPATNLPVMILESELMDRTIEDKETFYIPYRVINGEANKLKGFKPEFIRIHKGDNVEVRQVIIALCENKLSSMGEYNALLSRGII